MSITHWLSEPSLKAIKVAPAKVGYCGPVSKKKNKRRPHNKLNGLTYQEYIKSKRWRKRREAYFSKHLKKCVICPTTISITLHHLSYNNLGDEPDDDLVPLCWGCHESLHDWTPKKGKKLRHLSFQYIAEQQELMEMAELVRHL